MKLLLFAALCACALRADAPARARSVPRIIESERVEVRGGGELLTYFCTGCDSDGARIPLLSILKDTLGDSDPTNDRVRNVWIFPGPEPSLRQRVLAGLPFLYHRPAVRNSGKARPVSVLDLASPARGTWKTLAGVALQLAVLDPWGMRIRTPSRAYRVRAGEYRLMHIWQALDMMSLAAGADDPDAIAAPERSLIEGRLLLSRKVLGGYVDDPHAVKARRRDETATSIAAGHNWDLLRQKAEENGLYFEPLDAGARMPRFALLWFAEGSRNPNETFDGSLLSISDPFHDPRLKDPQGYTETWWLDAGGTRTSEGGRSARPVKMVPLAFYSLDYPGVPLLLVDFRNPGKAERRETLRRVGDDATLGVLGLTGIANWPFLAAKSGWLFVRSRHGAPTDREARIRAYVQFNSLLIAGGLREGGLRDLLVSGVGRLDINSLDARPRHKGDFARKQYAALLSMSRSGVLARSLDHEREREVSRSRHGAAARLGFGLLAATTLGAWRHSDVPKDELAAQVDLLRRFEYHRAYLESVLAAGPRPEIVAAPQRLADSISAMGELARDCDSCRLQAANMLQRVAARTGNQDLLARCLNCLHLIAGPPVDAQPEAPGQ